MTGRLRLRAASHRPRVLIMLAATRSSAAVAWEAGRSPRRSTPIYRKDERAEEHAPATRPTAGHRAATDGAAGRSRVDAGGAIASGRAASCGSRSSADRVPFAFVNARGELVGMDVELAQRLAQDAWTRRRSTSFRRTSRQMAGLLAEGGSTWRWACPTCPKLVTQVAYSAPYCDGSSALR